MLAGAGTADLDGGGQEVLPAEIELSHELVQPQEVVVLHQLAEIPRGEIDDVEVAGLRRELEHHLVAEAVVGVLLDVDADAGFGGEVGKVRFQRVRYPPRQQAQVDRHPFVRLGPGGEKGRGEQQENREGQCDPKLGFHCSFLLKMFF